MPNGGSIVLVDGMQQSGADQIRGVSRAQLPHGFRAVALESARTDLHPQGALLVGISLTDEAQDLAFAPGQRLLARFLRQHGARRAATLIGLLRPPLPSVFSVWLGRETFAGAADLFDQGANPLGLLEGVVHDLLQVIPVAAGLRELMTVLFDLAHVEQECRKRPVELTRDRRACLIDGPCTRRRRPNDFEFAVGAIVATRVGNLRSADAAIVL